MKIKCPHCSGTGKLEVPRDDKIRRVVEHLQNEGRGRECFPGCLGHLEQSEVSMLTHWNAQTVKLVREYMLIRGVIIVKKMPGRGRPAYLWHLIAEVK